MTSPRSHGSYEGPVQAEVMGYTSVARTPIVTGVCTIIFPTLAFALLGSWRLLVVGADSATAAILAAGLGGLGVSGLTPGSEEWLAWCSTVALICGVYVHQRGAQFGLAHADDTLLATLRTFGVLDHVAPDWIFSQIGEVFDPWEAQPPSEARADA